MPALRRWESSASSIFVRMIVKSSLMRALTTVLSARSEMEEALNPGVVAGSGMRTLASSGPIMADAEESFSCSACATVTAKASRMSSVTWSPPTPMTSAKRSRPSTHAVKFVDPPPRSITSAPSFFCWGVSTAAAALVPA